MYHSNKKQSLLGVKWIITEEETSEEDNKKIISEEEMFLLITVLMDISILILEIKVLEEISAPIEKNQRVGEIEFLSNNEVISVKPLYALESVEEGNFFNKIIFCGIWFL